MFSHTFSQLITGSFSYDVLSGSNLATISTSMITGGMIEATRFAEYLYQLVHLIRRNGLVITNSNMSYHFSDDSGCQILDACFTALTVYTLFSRTSLSDSELTTLQRLRLLCQLTTHKLFALQQCIFGVNTPCYVTESHMLHVFKALIKWFEFTRIFDTDIFERE